MSLTQIGKYADWIFRHYPTPESAFGKCAEACKAMKADFPELKITNGFADVAIYPEPRLHWWLVDADGVIVDPTAHQYPMSPEYQEIKDDHPARNYPQTRCPNCGERFFETPNRQNLPLCSSKCAGEYADYCNNASKEI